MAHNPPNSTINPRMVVILDQYNEFVHKKEELKKFEQKEKIDFILQFIEKRERIIIPQFEKIKYEAESRGYKVYIDTEPKKDEPQVIVNQDHFISIILDLSSFDEHAKYHLDKTNLPHLHFFCDFSTKKIRTHESTLGPGHGGHTGWKNEYQLSDINEQVVEKELMSWLESLMEDATNHSVK